MNGFITYTEAKTGEWICWLTETQPPRYATVVSMFNYPGEVHFGMGSTKEEALAQLEEHQRPVPR